MFHPLDYLKTFCDFFGCPVVLSNSIRRQSIRRRPPRTAIHWCAAQRIWNHNPHLDCTFLRRYVFAKNQLVVTRGSLGHWYCYVHLYTALCRSVVTARKDGPVGPIAVTINAAVVDKMFVWQLINLTICMDEKSGGLIILVLKCNCWTNCHYPGSWWYVTTFPTTNLPRRKICWLFKFVGWQKSHRIKYVPGFDMQCLED